jgi:hypothetical protein
VNLTTSGSKTFHLIRHGFPNTVNISRNRFSTFRRVPGGEALIAVKNASHVSFHDNDVASHAAATLMIALKFQSDPDVHKRRVTGWDVFGNRFRGTAKLPPRFEDPPIGTFDTCVDHVRQP